MPNPENKNFSIINTTKCGLPRLPLLKIKNKIIGENRMVSLVIISDARSRKLNKKYRNKSKPANVLTFPMGRKTGEIFINPFEVRRDMKRFGKTYDTLFALMFIHGLLHLKGRSHNSKMEREEEDLLKKFGF